MFAIRLVPKILVFLYPLVAEGQIEFSERIKLTDPINNILFSKVVDMDGDGAIDIFAATDNGLQATWWENDGSGHFTRHSWRPEKVLEQNIFGIADWNGDGRQDLWVRESGDMLGSGNNFRYLIAPGETDGTFGNPVAVIVATNEPLTYQEPLVADIDGDGRADIIGEGNVFLGNADGTFSRSVRLPSLNGTPIWQQTSNVTLHDYDRDWDLDIFIVGTSEGTVRYFENVGNGSFATHVSLFSLPAEEQMDGIVFVESHDPKAAPLLVTLTRNANNTGKMSAYDRTPDGGFVKASELLLPSTENGNSLDWFSMHRDSQASRAFVCCLISSSSTKLFEIRSSPAGLVTKYLSEHANVTLLGFTSVRDLNLDGNVDLIVPVPQVPGTSGSASDHIVWFEGDAEGGFSEAENVVIAPSYTRFLQHLGDLDGDGDNDLLLGNSLALGSSGNMGSFAVWSNSGDGRIFEKRDVPFFGNWAAVIANEDFVSAPPKDGVSPPLVQFELLTGRKDLIFVSSYSNFQSGAYFKLVYIAFQDGDGNFTPVVIESIGIGTSVHYRDWDGDGLRDLIYREPGGSIRWSRRNPNGFQSGVVIMSLPVNEEIFEFGKNFGFIDMDMDGDLDLFARGDLFGEGSSYWAERDAAGEILAVRKLPRGIRSLDYDVDEDGYDDFTNEEGKIVLLRSGVTFEFTNRFPLRPDTHFDLDDDGDLDEIVSAPTYGTSGFQRMFWSENMGDANDPVFGRDVFVDGVEFGRRDQFAVGDMDGDGLKDMLVISGDSALVEWFRITRKPEPTAFRQWMSGQGLTGSFAGPHADSDEDSSSNWEEFLFGTQAGIADLASNGRPRLENSGAQIMFTFQRRKAGSGLDLDYAMQRSTRLDDWEPWNPDYASPGTKGDYEIVRISVNPGEDAEFFRVKLPQIPE